MFFAHCIARCCSYRCCLISFERRVLKQQIEYLRFADLIIKRSWSWDFCEIKKKKNKAHFVVLLFWYFLRAVKKTRDRELVGTFFEIFKNLEQEEVKGWNFLSKREEWVITQQYGIIKQPLRYPKTGTALTKSFFETLVALLPRFQLSSASSSCLS